MLGIQTGKPNKMSATKFAQMGLKRHLCVPFSTVKQLTSLTSLLSHLHWTSIVGTSTLSLFLCLLVYTCILSFRALSEDGCFLVLLYNSATNQPHYWQVRRSREGNTHGVELLSGSVDITPQVQLVGGGSVTHTHTHTHTHAHTHVIHTYTHTSYTHTHTCHTHIHTHTCMLTPQAHTQTCRTHTTHTHAVTVALLAPPIRPLPQCHMTSLYSASCPRCTPLQATPSSKQLCRMVPLSSLTIHLTFSH